MYVNKSLVSDSGFGGYISELNDDKPSDSTLSDNELSDDKPNDNNLENNKLNDTNLVNGKLTNDAQNSSSFSNSELVDDDLDDNNRNNTLSKVGLKEPKTTFQNPLIVVIRPETCHNLTIDIPKEHADKYNLKPLHLSNEDKEASLYNNQYFTRKIQKHLEKIYSASTPNSGFAVTDDVVHNIIKWQKRDVDNS